MEGFFMSLIKRELDKHMARGFGIVPNKNVCWKCAGDKGLSLYIARRASCKTCNYCNRSEKINISIPLEQLITYIQRTLRSEYLEPEDAVAVFDDETQTWIDDIYDGEEMVREVEPLEEADEKLLDDISDVLSDNSYCLPYLSRGDVILTVEWLEFSTKIKHKCRFMNYHPQSILEENDKYCNDILEVVGKFIIEKFLISEVETRQFIKRVRLSEEPIGQSLNAQSLGTVPQELAYWDNRMSAAGISMFYGAQDLKTAIQETDPKNKNYYCVGEFLPSRKMFLVDFTKEIEVPSIYEEKLGTYRDIYSFMRNFVDSMTIPVKKREKGSNIDYIPTQTIAEYIRYVLTYHGKKLDGIIYKSSIPKCGNCYALFVDNQHCIEFGEKQDAVELNLIMTSSGMGKIADVVPAEELLAANSEPSEPV